VHLVGFIIKKFINASRACIHQFHIPKRNVYNFNVSVYFDAAVGNCYSKVALSFIVYSRNTTGIRHLKITKL